jgi:hypothetical protein
MSHDTEPPPVELLTANDIVWTSTGDPSPWPSSEDVLAAAVALLPVIEDNDVAALVEQLALALVDAREHLRGQGDCLCEALTAIHHLQVQVRGLRARLSTNRTS